MPGRVSPGIYTSELQFNDYVQRLGTTIPAIVGGATKGPVGVPTVISGEPDLIQQFGLPQQSDYALLAGVEFLRYGGQLVFLRVADSDVASSDATVQGLTGSTGGTAATGTITFTGGTNPDNGDTITIPDQALAATGSVTVTGAPAVASEVVLNDGTNAAVTFRFVASQGDVTQTVTLREVVIGTTTAQTALALQQAVENAPVLDITATVAGNVVSLTNDASGTGGNVAITETDSANALTIDGMSGGAASSNAIVYEFDTSTAATGNVAFAGQPSDGDQVVLDDGVNPAVTYEFQTSGGTITENDQYREVVIGASVGDTVTAFINKINSATATLDITAAPGAGDSADLTNDTVGAAGNVAITETGTNISATGMTGGTDAGTVGAGNVAVTVGLTAAATAQSLIDAIEAQRLAGNSAVSAALDDGAGDPVVNLTSTAAAGTFGNVTITATGSPATLAGFTGGVDPTPGSLANSVRFIAATPGSWGDDISVEVTAPTTAENAVTGGYDLRISAPVDNDGTVQVVEIYTNVTNDTASPRFIETVLSDGIRGEVAASEYLRADTIGTQAPASGTYTLGLTGLNVAAFTAGDDGIDGLVDTDYIGTLSETSITGLQTLRDPEQVEFNALAVPGVSDADVVDAMIDLARARGDALAVIDTPLGLSRDDAIDWHNGEAFAVAEAPTAALDDYRATLQWPWYKQFSEYLELEIFYPPSIATLQVYARTDNESPYRAPAGFQRGLIDGSSLEFNPRQQDRDLLNGGTNRINPIADFSSVGLVLYGNRTLQRAAGPLDSVSIARTLLFLKKAITTAIQYLQFEPNDPVTWRNFVQTVSPILTAATAERGLQAFSVKCDEETNPPSLQAQKTMRGRIFLTPVSAAEIIEIDFAVQSTGVTEFTV